MDPLTHVLSGALIARAAAPAQHRQGALSLHAHVTAGAAAAAFPDVDFALRMFGTLEYLNWHQGVTHSLVMLPLWAVLLAYLFARLCRGRYQWQAFLLPTSLGLAIHILGDLITAYGLMLFAPLSHERYGAALAFVIDPWMTAIIACGLILAAMLPHARSVAVAALIMLVGYVGLLAHFQGSAVAVGQAYARASGLVDADVHVLPQPLSPLHWKAIVHEEDVYHVAHLTLRDTGARSRILPELAAAYRPARHLEWIETERFGTGEPDSALVAKAWLQPEFEPFRRFAAYPVAVSIDPGGDGTCVWFLDLRFVLPSLPPSFRFGSCRSNDGQWRTVRHRGRFWID